MTSCSTSNSRKSLKFLSANTLEYSFNPISYPNASDCTNKSNGNRSVSSVTYNYTTTPTYTVSIFGGESGLTAYYGTWTFSGSDTPSYHMLIYPKDANEFCIGFGTDESTAKALTTLYCGSAMGDLDTAFTK